MALQFRKHKKLLCWQPLFKTLIVENPNLVMSWLKLSFSNSRFKRVCACTFQVLKPKFKYLRGSVFDTIDKKFLELIMIVECWFSKIEQCCVQCCVQVLDAPSLQDDFYLNLVDWSSQNTLAVGLGTCVYLWSASNSKVSMIMNFPSGNNITTCTIKLNIYLCVVFR